MAAVVVLGGVQGGVGTSTLAAGLAAALERRGQRVARFAVGPGLAARPPGPAALASLPQQPVGLDGCLLTPDGARAALLSGAAAADVCLVEGASGGVFDSPPGAAAAGCDEQGSTVQLAAWLSAPLVLVVDGQAFGAPRALAALLRGYAAAGGDGSAGAGGCRLAGVIINKAPRPSAAAEARDALARAGLAHVAVLGGVPLLPDFELPPATPAWAATGCSISLQGWVSCARQQEALAQHVAQHVDLQALARLAAAAAVPRPAAPLPPPARAFSVSLALAWDEAFFRYFQANLAALQAAGVQLLPFSPLHDAQLPAGVSAVLLGGGAAAEHAQQLAANGPMLAALRAFAAAGGFVLGEAGGLAYLSQSLQAPGDQQQRHAMGECELGAAPAAAPVHAR